MEWGFATSPKPIQVEKNTRITMRQYTTPEQTAKLIELGFEKPKNERWVLDVVNESTPSIQNTVNRQDYSIGELIEILNRVDDEKLEICRDCGEGWLVGTDLYCASYRDLIDALYDMVRLLKEKGVI